MKISKEQYDFIHKDLYLIDYLTKIFKNEYYYWRNKDEIKAKKFISTSSDLQYLKNIIYRKKSNQVKAIIELEQFEKGSSQLSLDI